MARSAKPRKLELGKAFRNIPFLGALLIVFVVNVALFLFNPIKDIDPESLPAEHGWAWWAAQDIRARNPAPNVVVMGSSAMMHPLWLQESAYRNSDVDLACDHQSHYLESVIAQHAPGTKPNCFNFALPGAMPSDEYMILSALIACNHKPKIAVIGVHPRDLMDNSFTCAISSKHYKYLSRFTKAEKYIELAMPQLWRQLAYRAESMLYLKNKNHDVQLVLSSRLSGLVEPAIANFPDSKLDVVLEQDQRAAKYVDEIEKGVWIAHPTSPYVYVDATRDCMRRFKDRNDELFTNQKTWLEMCLSLCKHEGIKPVLVNMPNSEILSKLMPNGAYERHVTTIQALARAYDCPYLDLNVKDAYALDDYTDWIHMNASGGRKAIGMLGKFIAANQNLASALAAPPAELATKEHAHAL